MVGKLLALTGIGTLGLVGIYASAKFIERRRSPEYKIEEKYGQRMERDAISLQAQCASDGETRSLQSCVEEIELRRLNESSLLSTEMSNTKVYY